MKALVLNVDYPSRASYYEDWRDAFERAPRFDTTVVNIVHRRGRRLVKHTVRDYELIVVLHSCMADSLDYVEPLTGALQGRRGRLVSFVGNEINLPWAPLGEKIEWLRAVQPDVIATQLLPEAGEWLYAGLGADVVSLPHALNPDAFRPHMRQADRPIDLGTRTYRYLAYLGDDDRNRMYDFFLNNRFDPPLTLDFSTGDRFDRAGWAAFLNRCKGTVSSEAGSWYLERDDTTVRAIRAYVAGLRSGVVLAANSPLRRFAHRVPYPVKAALRHILKGGPVQYEAVADEALDFEEIYARFFKDRTRCPAYSKCISSRHFDAIGTKTLQIMFPGRFNNILEADRHYLALAPDFSNIDEVIEQFRDRDARQQIVDETYDYIRAEHTYQHRLDALATVLN